MSFLAPVWLLLGAAAAIPLLLHLLRRRTGVRTEFPAARYLLRAEREHSQSLRLRNLLLMALRIAIVLLLALAAAAPVTRWFGGAGGRVPTALAIVLDNSMSTRAIVDGRPVFERLRDDARAVAANAIATDRLWIVGADGAVSAGTSATAERVIDELQPLDGAGDLPGALRKAASLAAAGDLAPRVVLITDGQRTSWPGAVELPGDPVVVVSAPGTKPPANRAVVVAEAVPDRWTPRGRVEVRVRAGDSVAFRAAVLSAGAARRTIGRGVIAPGEVMTLPVAPTDTGWISGFIEIDGDELPADDLRYFAAWVGSAPAAASAPGAGSFVASALDALGTSGRVRAGDDVIVLDASDLARASETRPMLIAPPQSPAAIGAANRGLARRGIPWRFGSPRSDRLRSPDMLAGARVTAAYQLVPAGMGSADTLARGDAGPWAVAGVAGATPYVLVASPLVPEATDLPVRAAFVPWLASMIEHLAGHGALVAAAPGDSVMRPRYVDALQSPEGRRSELSDRWFTAPGEAGVHFFMRGGARAGALVVNAKEDESVLDRMSDDELVDRIGSARSTAAARLPGWPEAAFAAGTTRALLQPLLLLVLLLVVLEGVGAVIKAPGAA